MGGLCRASQILFLITNENNLKMASNDQLIKSYERDIENLQRDIDEHGTTPAANRTLKRLKEKRRKLRNKV